MQYRDDPWKFASLCGLCGVLVALCGASRFGAIMIVCALVGLFLGVLIAPVISLVLGRRDFVSSIALPLAVGIVVALVGARAYYPGLILVASLASVALSIVSVRLATPEMPVRRSMPACHCGYRIISTSSDRCSECGRPILTDVAPVSGWRQLKLPAGTNRRMLMIIPTVVVPLIVVLWGCGTVNERELRSMIDSGAIVGKTTKEIESMLGWLRHRQGAGMYTLNPWSADGKFMFLYLTTDQSGMVSGARLVMP